MILAIFLASSWEMPSLRLTLSRYSLPDSFGLAGVEDLERDLAPDQLVLEDVQHGVGAFLAVGLDLYALIPGPGDGGADVPEVEPRADLLDRLVQRVVDFLPVELGHDVK